MTEEKRSFYFQGVKKLKHIFEKSMKLMSHSHEIFWIFWKTKEYH